MADSVRAKDVSIQLYTSCFEKKFYQENKFQFLVSIYTCYLESNECLKNSGFDKNIEIEGSEIKRIEYWLGMGEKHKGKYPIPYRFFRKIISRKQIFLF